MSGQRLPEAAGKVWVPARDTGCSRYTAYVRQLVCTSRSLLDCDAGGAVLSSTEKDTHAFLMLLEMCDCLACRCEQSVHHSRIVGKEQQQQQWLLFVIFTALSCSNLTS